MVRFGSWAVFTRECRNGPDSRTIGLILTVVVETVRLDKWLWTVRLFKTRALATSACRKSAARINGEVAKPSAKVRIGDRVTTKARDLTITYRIVALTDKRIGAARLPEFVQDETPEEEFERARERKANSRTVVHTGRGRPTKKNRRDLEKFLGRGSE